MKKVVSENKELQSKLNKIKQIIESDISKNRMKTEILKIINDGKEEVELLPALEEFSSIKAISKSH